jgi:O-antigen/teichoic acid export membrane protein
MKLTIPNKLLSLIRLPLTTVINFIHLSSIQVSNALLQLLLFPIIIRVVGLSEFGHVMVANSYASLLGIVINYGTNQSGIKDIALYKNNPEILSQKFYRIFSTRLLLFLVSLLVLPILYVAGIPYFQYFLFATTLVIAEVINPIFFFIGIEKLFAFNLANLLSKLLSILLVLLFVNGANNANRVNFYLGLSNIILYAPLIIYATRKFSVRFYLPGLPMIWLFIKENFSLFINNISVQLQQSVFLFAVSAAGNPIVLGAYALCDKIIWSFRLLIIAFSNAIYPRCTILYHQHFDEWQKFKRSINKSLIVSFFFSGLLFIIFPALIVHIFTGQKNDLTIFYLKAIAFVPLIMALNSMNVLELLIKNAYTAIFSISLIVLSFAIGISLLFIWVKAPMWYPFYPLCIETACLLFYRYYLNKKNFVSTH